MSYVTDKRPKAQVAKADLRKFHRPQFVEVLAKIEKEARAGRDQLELEEGSIDINVIKMLKEEGFIFSTGLNKFYINWAI